MKQTSTTPIHVETRGIAPGQITRLKISEENSRKIMISLSSVYSDTLLATIREISTNAHEANQMIGNGDYPINISLPNALEPSFVVRDFGPGIAPDKIEKIYMTYGNSTKDSSNEFGGTFGYGSKTPFALTDSFTVKSYYGGVCYTYTMVNDEMGYGFFESYREDSDEPSGLEVIIPIEPADIDTFNNKAHRFYQDFKPTPNFTNRTFDLIAPRYEAGNIKIYDKTSGLATGFYISQANNVYPLLVDDLYYNRDHTGKTYFDSYTDKNAYQSIQKDMRIVISVPTGTIEFPPSRESIKYESDLTKANLRGALNSLITAFSKDAQDKMNTCSSYIEAIIMSTSIRESYGDDVFSYLSKFVTWNDNSLSEIAHRNINKNNFAELNDLSLLLFYKRSWRSENYKHRWDTYFQYTNKTKIYFFEPEFDIESRKCRFKTRLQCLQDTTNLKDNVVLFVGVNAKQNLVNAGFPAGMLHDLADIEIPEIVRTPREKSTNGPKPRIPKNKQFQGLYKVNDGSFDYYTAYSNIEDRKKSLTEVLPVDYDLNALYFVTNSHLKITDHGIESDYKALKALNVTLPIYLVSEANVKNVPANFMLFTDFVNTFMTNYFKNNSAILDDATIIATARTRNTRIDKDLLRFMFGICTTDSKHVVGSDPMIDTIKATYAKYHTQECTTMIAILSKYFENHMYAGSRSFLPDGKSYYWGDEYVNFQREMLDMHNDLCNKYSLYTSNYYDMEKMLEYVKAMHTFRSNNSEQDFSI